MKCQDSTNSVGQNLQGMSFALRAKYCIVEGPGAHLYSKRKDFYYVLLALSVACYFAYVTFGYTTEDPIIRDAHDNARAAYHLVHTGVMGADAVETANPKPQVRREPVLILVIAGVSTAAILSACAGRAPQPCGGP